MSNKKDPFTSIENTDLSKVSGGAARVAASSRGNQANDQLMMMMTQIGDSIKDLAKNNNGGDQTMQMLMMMMMMGGMGGGGGGMAPAPMAAAPGPTYIQVTAKGGGKKGW